MILSVVVFTHLITVFTDSNDKILRKVQEKDKKNLYNLGFCERDKEFNDPNQVIIIFCSYQLNYAEKLLLAKEFALPLKVLNHTDYSLPLEMVYWDIKTLLSDLDIIKVALKEYAYSFFKKYNFLKELNLLRDEYNTLKNLLSLKNIIIQKSDKGNSVVLMDRNDCINRMETLISDPAKLQKLLVPESKDCNFTVKEKRLVNNILDTLYEKNAIACDIETIPTPDGPSHAWLYGLPKIHKVLVDGLPNYRPIISKIGSPRYKTAKFLLGFISPITKNEYTLKH